MSWRTWLVGAACAAMLILLASCGTSPESSKGASHASKAAAAGKGAPLRFGLALGSGGLGDKGFNDLQYTGMARACAAHDVSFVYEAAGSGEPQSVEAQFDRMLAKGCNVLFCAGGEEMQGPIDEYAPQHPNVRFVLMDKPLMRPLPNAASAVFRTSEPAYLAGMLAARMSRSGVLGVVGGMKLPTVMEYVVGFRAGARAARKDIRVITEFIAERDATANPWRNPGMGNELASELMAEGADILFGVAGGSSLGVFDAATREGRYAIGVDSDQDHLAKGIILTSVVKRLDNVIEDMVGRVINGSFEPKAYVYRLRDGGVGLSNMRFSRQLIPDEVFAEIARTRQKIITGDIVVPTVY